MSKLIEVKVPDIGDFKDVPVIEMHVKAGDKIKKEDAIVTLETSKAAMEVPSPYAGVVKSVSVKVGDAVSEGSVLLMLEAAESADKAESKPLMAKEPEARKPAAKKEEAKMPEAPQPAQMPVAAQTVSFAGVHASPSIRHFARELGVDLTKVSGSGPKGRITREDVSSFVKGKLSQPNAGFGLPEIPVIDFSKFGSVEERPLSRIQKISGAQLHKNWIGIPHVTQFIDADITELDDFRKSLLDEFAKKGAKLTFLPFLMKAVVSCLKNFPEFNASLGASDTLVLKHYYHIGVAVDTPEGLVVPVVRDVDKKSVLELAVELGQIGAKARDKKLTAAEMQGGSFTISSLGGIGGTGFTPIINAPEVAILGVSKSSVKPVFEEGAFVPRLMLPLSLSYDHRVIDGAMAARFAVALANFLADIRRLVI